METAVIKRRHIFFLMALAVLCSGTLFAGGEAVIDAGAGLRMREAPGQEAKIITVVPDKTKVAILEEKPPVVEVAGRKGMWTRIKWGKHSGWVFGGFLSKESGNVTVLALRPDMPTDWVQVRKEKGEWVTNTYCNAEKPSVRIERGPSGAAILIGYGQDGVRLEIERIIDQNEVMFFVTRPTGGQKSYKIRFQFTKEKGIGKWRVFGDMDKDGFFIDRDSAKGIKNIQEKCDQ
ncbi:MAG: SH3 domain-containing protein [Spirochaetes bacterium]|jgi:hypothetical protein|nr:SH3 domain-containing protein [Spirochaetota bacterium]